MKKQKRKCLINYCVKEVIKIESRGYFENKTLNISLIGRPQAVMWSTSASTIFLITSGKREINVIRCKTMTIKIRERKKNIEPTKKVEH